MNKNALRVILWGGLFSALVSGLAPAVFAEDFDSKDLEKAAGLVIYLPERGVSAKLQLFQESKPARGILKPFVMNDGSQVEIDQALVLDVVEMSTLLPESLILNKESILAQCKSRLEELQQKYPKFADDWKTIVKAQEKERSLVAQGYVKQKHRWISAVEWDIVQKNSVIKEKPATRLVTKDGKTFNKAKLSRIEGTNLIITYESGIAKIPKENLPGQLEPADAQMEAAISKIMSAPDPATPQADAIPAAAPTPASANH